MNKSLNVLAKLVSVALAIGVTASGCNKSASFSLLSDTASFTQNSAAVNGKIDILFVIDNSGSMQPYQSLLTSNINRFFDKFDAKGFDYQIAVTTTDAWRVQFGGPAAMAQYRDGTDATSHTGIYVVKPSTPNKVSVFDTNVTQGTQGNGDERAFQSFESAMTSSLNAGYGFPRSDAFFAIIMMSDADDLSNTTPNTIDTAPSLAMYSNPNIIPIQHYLDFLDGKFGVNSAADRTSKYNVNTIGILDSTCQQKLNSSEQKTAVRMGALSDATSGIKGSLCDDFGTTLSNISSKVIELRTRFYLDRQLNPSTLQVSVNGVSVPQVTDSTPQPWNGFYYNSSDNSISFYGTAVPGPGANISVSFDPTSMR